MNAFKLLFIAVIVFSCSQQRYTDAILGIAMQYYEEHHENWLEILVHDHDFEFIKWNARNEAFLVDEWDNPIDVQYPSSGGIVFRSAGSNGILGDEDDIVRESELVQKSSPALKSEGL